MAVQTMNEIFQQVATLTSAFNSDEKRALAEFLLEQAKRDIENGGASSQSNGTHQKQGERDPYRKREYAWLKEHRHEFVGQYLALDGDRLVSHGMDGREVLESARRTGVPIPLMVRVSEDDELPFCGGW